MVLEYYVNNFDTVINSSMQWFYGVTMLPKFVYLLVKQA